MMPEKPPTPTLMNAPKAPAPPPMFGQMQPGKKPQAKSQNKTFLSADTIANPTNTGQKTLLGQ